MKRPEAEELIVREFSLCVRDFRKTPTVSCWNALEASMFALQWVKLAKDAEADPFLEHLPTDIPPNLLCETIADYQRQLLAEASAAVIAGALKRPRKDLKRKV